MTFINLEETSFTLTVKDRVTQEDILLQGKVFLPKNETIRKSRLPAICLCHGIPGGRAALDNPVRADGPGKESLLENYPKLAQWFSQKGFATFTFNFRGTGESGGNFDLGEWTEDLRTVLDYIFQHPGIQKDRVILVGFSGGAAVSIYTASRNPQIHAVVSLACPADFNLLINESRLEETLKRLRKIGIIRDAGFPPDPKAWLNRALSLRPLENIEKISPRPVLIIHGTEDEIIPPEQAIDLFRAASRPKDLFLIEGAGHRLKNNAQALHYILEWIKKIKIFN
ncbi:alpha/beta hydrolase [Candidatus Contubernalis alkaliaceticus]|uniref:alpha/beta hydrolase n=1 Tax=Candidatus Contubernalis alkaliaceticus TaxID=338645 RepID=UPI001F4C2609|nr:alpha/beta fold hydrolase [Candidatus Contubernalis alkalaceticus]UNC93428.1 alpha/beta fold hydrolase [Candidatus Contubernalis alkalaceticus]